MSCKVNRPEIERRVAHLKAFEKEFKGREMWKKKYDWTCPGCGGLLMNIGGNIFKNDFLMECLVCQKRYVSGDHEIHPVNDKDPEVNYDIKFKILV